MKFINRENELKQLEEYYKLSKKRLQFIALSGLRRVGKTTLIREFIKNKKSIYFFVYDFKSPDELLYEFTKILKQEEIITEFEKLDSWDLFFKIIFTRCKNYIIVFDEFQNFYNIDKSVFSILQKYIDENKDVPMNLIILGSLIGLFKKILEDKKEPLFGRINAKMNLDPFTIENSFIALSELNYKDIDSMIQIYGVFGGFPKYYSVIEQFDLNNKQILEIINYLFIQDNAPLESEVMDILKQEFGRRSSTYYSILYAISKGNNKLNEIADFLHLKDGSITRHLIELEDKFGLIKSTNAFGNKRNTKYIISHPLIKFWFRFVYDKFSTYKLNKDTKLLEYIKTEFDTYFGKVFEIICYDVLINLNRNSKLPFTIDYLANWWGYKKIDGKRNEIEIDLIGLNEKENKVLFTEVKWKKNVDVISVLKDLQEKSTYFQWRKETRQEYFCIIARSFKEKNNEKLKVITKEYKNLLLIDLNSIKEITRLI